MQTQPSELLSAITLELDHLPVECNRPLREWTSNDEVIRWIKEVAQLAQPDRIYLCDGSDQEWDLLTEVPASPHCLLSPSAITNPSTPRPCDRHPVSQRGQRTARMPCQTSHVEKHTVTAGACEGRHLLQARGPPQLVRVPV